MISDHFGQSIANSPENPEAEFSSHSGMQPGRETASVSGQQISSPEKTSRLMSSNSFSLSNKESLPGSANSASSAQLGVPFQPISTTGSFVNRLSPPEVGTTHNAGFASVPATLKDRHFNGFAGVNDPYQIYNRTVSYGVTEGQPLGGQKKGQPYFGLDAHDAQLPRTVPVGKGEQDLNSWRPSPQDRTD